MSLFPILVEYLDDKTFSGHPGMFENVADVDSVLDTPGEAAGDQVPHLGAHPPGEHQLAGEDLGVLLPGDVATHHVV